MLQFTFILAISLLACSNAQDRIIGGTATVISRFPYMVAMYYKGAYYCEGAIGSEYHVITAAHCVQGRIASQIVSVVGTTTLKEQGQRRDVDKIWYPSVYNKTTMDMDIAVIKLKTPFIFGEKVQKIALCSKPLTMDAPLRLIGWGKVYEASKVASNELRTVTVPLIAYRYCAERFAPVNITLTSTMFCAGTGDGVEPRDSCNGDSGGPGVINNEICGIVSFGKGCARPGFPGIYTNLNNVKIRKFLLEALRR